MTLEDLKIEYDKVNTKDILINSDYLIAEVSYPGIGIGLELGRAECHNIPILCLIKRGIKRSSSIPRNFKIIEYNNEEDIINNNKKRRITMAIFCTIYYVLTYVKTIPQIIKLIKTKSSNDYSMGSTIIQLIAIISWSLYIFTSKQNIIVYIGTITDLLLLIFTDYLILRYYSFKEKDANL